MHLAQHSAPLTCVYSPLLTQAGASIGGDAALAPSTSWWSHSVKWSPDLLIISSFLACLHVSGSMHYWEYHAIESLKYLSSFRKDLPENHTDPQVMESLDSSHICRFPFLCAFFFFFTQNVCEHGQCWLLDKHSFGVMVKGQYWNSIVLLNEWTYVLLGRRHNGEQFFSFQRAS